MPVKEKFKTCKSCKQNFPADYEHFYKVGKRYVTRSGAQSYFTSFSTYCKKCMSEKNFLRKHNLLSEHNIIDIVDELLSLRGEDWLKYVKECNRKKREEKLNKCLVGSLQSEV